MKLEHEWSKSTSEINAVQIFSLNIVFTATQDYTNER